MIYDCSLDSQKIGSIGDSTRLALGTCIRLAAQDEKYMKPSLQFIIRRLPCVPTSSIDPILVLPPIVEATLVRTKQNVVGLTDSFFPVHWAPRNSVIWGFSFDRLYGLGGTVADHIEQLVASFREIMWFKQQEASGTRTFATTLMKDLLSCTVVEASSKIVTSVPPLESPGLRKAEPPADRACALCISIVIQGIRPKAV